MLALLLAADLWLAQDKLLHVTMSAGVAQIGYGAAGLATDKPLPRHLSGAALALSLGAGKELYDWRHNGDASWRDLGADALGAAIGLLIAWWIT